MIQEAKLENRLDIVSKRYGIVLASSAGVGVLTDFTSPIGGFYISAGILAICVFLMFLIWLKRAWIIQLIQRRKFLQDTLGDFLPIDIAWYKTPLFHYAFIGATVFGYTCYATNANAYEGGALASKFDQVTALQSMMGIMKNVDGRVRRIEDAVTSIDRKMDNVKKEHSDDPRIQLANEGVNWTHAGFTESLRDDDQRRILLYLEGGMKMNSEDMRFFMGNFDKGIGEKILDVRGVDKKACEMSPDIFVSALDSVEETEFLHALCANQKFNSVIRRAIENKRPEAEKQLQMKRNPDIALLECIKETNSTLPSKAMFQEALNMRDKLRSMPGWSPWGTSGLARTFEPKEVAVMSLATSNSPMSNEKYNEVVKKACLEHGVVPDEALIKEYEQLTRLSEKIFY